VQRYEGGFTLFGPHTLDAYIQASAAPLLSVGVEPMTSSGLWGVAGAELRGGVGLFSPHILDPYVPGKHFVHSAPLCFTFCKGVSSL
jgi:hypothetical protein